MLLIVPLRVNRPGGRSEPALDSPDSPDIRSGLTTSHEKRIPTRFLTARSRRKEREQPTKADSIVNQGLMHAAFLLARPGFGKENRN